MKFAHLLTLFLATTAFAAERPNLLFIAIDDLRPELGCYGGTQVRTPYIDRLAGQGMRFNRAYCQVPICMGSRASLLTGMLPTSERFVGDCRADVDVPNAATLPEVFRKAGYTTLSNGKIFHNPADTAQRSWSEPPWQSGSSLESHDPETTRRLSTTKQRGRIFESPDVPDEAYPDGRVAKKTIEDLRRLKKSGKPFFLACGFVKPHMPFYAPKKYWDLYERDQIRMADNRRPPAGAPRELKGSGEFRSYHLADLDENSDAFHRMMRHGYLACTSYVDQLIGEVLAELERLGLAENTIVVLWGDHGWHLGEHNFWGKHNTMHLAIRVPLIVKVPGIKAGSTQALVETSDLFPTLCALAGLPAPETVQGRSFSEILGHPEKSFRATAYSRFQSADAVITPDFSFTRYNDGKAEMLYDLVNDPRENVNIAGKPEHAETVGKMRKLLAERVAEGGRSAASEHVAPTGAASKKVDKPGHDGKVPRPTHSEVKYGLHERNVLDFWQAKSDSPTPLVLVIHGGGWVAGSKERVSRFADVQGLLDAGISVAANNYRFIAQAAEEGVTPPVKAPMHDSARALQFLRSKASEWNIDPARIGAAGGSAGACTSLWLAYHDDLADPRSNDPVARQSTRLMCAAVMGAQTTLDPRQAMEWIPNSSYGGHAFGKDSFAQALAGRESLLPWIAEYSPFALTTRDDPPVAIFYSSAPDMGKDQKDPTHSANFGIGLQRRCQELGIRCDVIYPGSPEARYQTPTTYLIEMFAKKNRPAPPP